MQKKSKSQMERAKLIKASRTLLRLKHTLAYDEELNNVLPDQLAQFDDALAKGNLMSLEASLSEALGGNNALGA